MWGRGLIGKESGGREGCIADGHCMKEGGGKVEEKMGSGGTKDVGATLHGEGLFLFFWQMLVECYPHPLSADQT